MAPPFLSGDDDDWKKISKEIIMATTALKLCQEGKVTSPPPDEQLRLFQHILVLVTTDEFQEDSTTSTEKPKKSDASIVNAVTGRVEADRIVSVFFTHNAIPIGETSTGGTFKQITSQDNGKVLLDGWETMQDKVSFDKHLQDVVDILQHLLRGDRGTTDVGAALLFVHRRAFPKLASRVRKAVHLWGGAPFSLISQYYKDSKSPIAVTSASFLLRDIGGGMHGDLETLTLPCNSSYRSSDGSRQYFVNSENVVRWVDFIHSTYSKIEEIVERNMIYGGRVTVRPLSVRDAIALVEAISVLNRLLHAKALMTTIFSMNGLKKYIVEKFESARSKAVWSNVTKTGGAELSTLEVTDDAAESEDREDEDEDEDAIGDAELLDAREEEDASDISELQLGADIHMLWYCRTITAWSEAVSAIGRHTARLPDAMDLQVFQVDTFPSPETVCKSNVNDFTRRYLATLTDDNKQTQSAKAFVADRLGKSFRKKANHPVVHAEATAMGLICISVFGGESFGDFTKEWVDKALPTSGKIPIAVSKKCCKCCAILVELLNERGKGEFVLPGTHATFFPWCPPRGVPLDILKEMRDRLYDIFDFQARNFIPSPLSTRSSPAMSEASLPVDEMLPKPRSE